MIPIPQPTESSCTDHPPVSGNTEVCLLSFPCLGKTQRSLTWEAEHVMQQTRSALLTAQPGGSTTAEKKGGAPDWLP